MHVAKMRRGKENWAEKKGILLYWGKKGDGKGESRNAGQAWRVKSA